MTPHEALSCAGDGRGERGVVERGAGGEVEPLQRRPRGTRCCNRLSRSSGDREAQVLAFPMVFRGVFARTSGVQASARILTYFGPLGFLMCWPMGWVGPNCRCDLFLFFHFGFKLASDSAGKLLDGSMVWNGDRGYA